MPVNFRSFSALRGLVVASLVGTALLSGAHGASAQTTVFDSLTNAASFAITSSTPHTQIGQVFTLGNVAAGSSVSITGSDFLIGSTAVASYNFIQVTQYFWASASLATTGTTAAYSTLLGARTYTLTNQTFAASTVYTFNGGAASFGTSPIALSGLTTANTIGFSELVSTSTDGINYTLNDAILPAFSVGTPAVGTSAFNSSATSTNYYRNASNESNGNFLGSSARNLGALDYIGVRLYANVTPAAAPEPGSLSLVGMGLISGAGIVARRRRKVTAQA